MIRAGFGFSKGGLYPCIEHGCFTILPYGDVFLPSYGNLQWALHSRAGQKYSMSLSFYKIKIKKSKSDVGFMFIFYG